jgi:hypothetical protein
MRDYQKLSSGEKKSLAKELNIVREGKINIIRANPKALQHDVNASFAAMEREVRTNNMALFHCGNWWATLQWTALMRRTGVQGFYVAVRGSVEEYHEPKVFFSEKALKFVKDVIGLEPKQLALKLEGWCVSGLGKKYCRTHLAGWVWREIDQAPTSTRQPQRAKVVSNCRALIQEGLGKYAHALDICKTHICVDEILHENNLIKGKILMNYDNYELKIVERHGVALEGWPSGRVQNPGKVGGRRDIMRLFDALSSGSCHWVVLTEQQIDKRKKHNQEREDRGETVYKARRAHTKKTKDFKSPAVVDNDVNDEGEGERDNDEGTMQCNDEGTTQRNDEGTTQRNDEGTMQRNDGGTTQCNNEGTTQRNDEGITQCNNEGTMQRNDHEKSVEANGGQGGFMLHNDEGTALHNEGTTLHNKGTTLHNEGTTLHNDQEKSAGADANDGSGGEGETMPRSGQEA